MITHLLGRAFAAAHNGYFLAGVHMARALSDSQYLHISLHEGHPRAYRQLGQLWNQAHAPLQGMLMNKLSDTILKSDFSPRPTSDVMKKMAMPLLRMVPQMLPRLLSSPALGIGIAMAGIMVLDPTVRTMVIEQATQVAAIFTNHTGDMPHGMDHSPPAEESAAHPNPVRIDAQPSVF